MRCPCMAQAPRAAPPIGWGARGERLRSPRTRPVTTEDRRSFCRRQKPDGLLERRSSSRSGSTPTSVPSGCSEERSELRERPTARRSEIPMAAPWESRMAGPSETPRGKPKETGEARSALLAATADGVLARFALGSSLDQPIEPVLREMITEPKRINSFLQDLTPSRVDVGIQIFQLFPELSERLFEAWLIRWIANSRDVDAKTSSEFGQLIGARKWANCAERLENELTRNGRFDLIPAIHGCYQLLGFLKQVADRDGG